MAPPIMGGIISKGVIPADEIIGADLFAPGRERVKQKFGIHVTADNNEVVEEEVIKYNNYSGKKILIALDNHLDINKFTELLVNYNVDISTSSSIEELTELLRSDKTFDIVFLSNTISGIENYNITTSEERKRTMTKLSLIAGYKLQIIMVTLEDYKDSDTEYIKMPISKVKLDDIMVKYLSEK